MPKHCKRNELPSSKVGLQSCVTREQCGVSLDQSDPDIETILYLYDFRYILGQVKRAAFLRAQISHPDVLDLEMEDIAREVPIHFWQKPKEQMHLHKVMQQYSEISHEN